MPTVLYIGSSIFKLWPGIELVAPWAEVVNLAVGATTTAGWLNLLDDSLRRSHPDMVCLYIGSNDIQSTDATVEEMVGNIKTLINGVRSFNPAAAVVYHTIIKAPKRNRADLVDRVNLVVEDFINQTDGAFFIDINPIFFEDGKAKIDFFIEDGIHLTAAAYDEMRRFTAPLIREIAIGHGLLQP